MAEPYYQDDAVTLWHGDALTVLRDLPDGSVDSCVTSPPYFGLRDYGVEGQMGAEASPAEYVEGMRTLFAEVLRVLAWDGTLWLNLGDTYSTPKRGSDKGWDKSRLNNPARVQKMQFAAMREGRNPDFDRPTKSLLGIPWRVAFALQDDGWILRSDIIWAKPSPMPEPVKDRPTRAHEYVFLLTKSGRYHYDGDAIRETATGGASGNGFARPESISRNGRGADARWEGGTTRNARDVWSIVNEPTPWAHFATMPLALAERCVQAGCKPGGTVLDPFSGSGTTGLAAARHGRKYVGIDLNADYLKLSLETRLQQAALDFGGVA